MKLMDLPWRRADMVMARARAEAIRIIAESVAEDLRSDDPEKRKAAIEAAKELGIFPTPGPPPSSLADVMRAARGISD